MLHFNIHKRHNKNKNFQKKSYLKYTALIILSIVISIYWVRIATNESSSQDAYQYITNLDSNLYSDDYEKGFNKIIFSEVVQLAQKIPGISNPFYVIGVIVCSMYILLSTLMNISTLRRIAFAILLTSPLFYFNYTEVIRQGMASVLILYGLFFSSNFLISLALLITGSLTHQIFTPFSMAIITRIILVKLRKSKNNNLSIIRINFDFLLLILFSVFFIAAILLQNNSSNNFINTLNLSLEDIKIKRLFPSILLLTLWYTISTKDSTELNGFTKYLLVANAFMLPFVSDFTRMQTLVIPFATFSAIECKSNARWLISTCILITLSLYVIIIQGFN